MNSDYKTQSEDTTKEAESLQIEQWRQLTPAEKLHLVQNIARRGIKLALMGIKHEFPFADALQIKTIYLKKRWGQPLADFLIKLDHHTKLMLDDPISFAYQLAIIFDQLSIPYYVGGSVASSIHGEIRFTTDLDLAVYLLPQQKELFIKTLTNELFYISNEAVEQAINRQISSFNIIKNSEKADIFLVDIRNNFQNSVMNRRQKIVIPDKDDNIYICSAEDIILQKLLRYRVADNQSQKQWRDILGVLKVQNNRLDFTYLWEWGENLGILEQLNQAFLEAGV